MPIKVFFCYAHEDRKMLARLQKHLKPLQQHGYIETWYDQNVSAGAEWEPEIIKHLHEAQIILLLISADFMASDYCYDKEMKWALQQHERGKARVIPIILRDVLWQYGPFSKLQALPSEAKPVYKWIRKDEAYKDITEGIAKVIEELSLPSLLKSAKKISQATSLQRKKALLILTGGSVLPDILTLLYYRPQLVFVIAPHGWRYQRTYMDIAKTLPFCKMKIMPLVNPHDIDACLQACLDSYFPYTNEELKWVMTTYSATKVMALAGYEFAKQNGIISWLIDLAQERIITVGMQTDIDTRKFFHPTVSEYLKNHEHALTEPKSTEKAYREQAEIWSHIAKDIIQSPEAKNLLSLLVGKNKKEPIVFPAQVKTAPLFCSLIKAGMVKIIQEYDDGTIACRFPSSYSERFFSTGEWLMLYIWREILDSKIADDCQWECDIVYKREKFDIDLALTYRARLLLVECKTGQHPYQLNSLSMLEAIAHRLGRSYVSRILLTSNSSTQEPPQSFCEQAQLRNTVIVTWEDLPNIVSIIKRTLLAPTYILP